MKLNTLEELFIHELKDLYSAENQIIEALPTVIEATQNKETKTLLKNHLKETQNQIKRLEEISEFVNRKLSGEKCIGMEGLIKEVNKVLKADGDTEIIDKALIEGGTKVEAYEITTYESAIANARRLGEKEVATKLTKSLDEEKEMKKALKKLP